MTGSKTKGKSAKNSDAQENQHFVYVYRDFNKQPFYVGYGASAARAASHVRGTHNEQLKSRIKKGKYSIDIVGPFASKDLGMMVETILISAIPKLLVNEHMGATSWRLRPLGVPESFANRLDKDAISVNQIGQILMGRRRAGSAIFVLVTAKDLKHGPGYRLDSPPSDEEILARIEKWWRLKTDALQWKDNSKNSPTILIAVTGSPTHRIIVGSVAIDQNGWSASLADSKKLGKARVAVPTKPTKSLDAFDLRGRIVKDIKFLRHGHVVKQFGSVD